MSVNYQEEELLEVLDDVGVEEGRDLMIFNDDYNTFEHVINTLIKVCEHNPQQAEQCTIIIHHKGKCSVKKGYYDVLKPMKVAICDVGIDAKIV